MIQRMIFLQLLIFLLSFDNPASAVEYGLFLEDSMLIEKDDNTAIERTEIELSLRNLSYSFRQDILENSPYNKKNITLVDNTDTKTDEFFEFVGMFISNYKSSTNLKIKVKFTKDAELDKGSIIWRIAF